MAARAHPAFFWIFLLVLAPVGAAVLISALLLFGVQAHYVFAPGYAVKAWLHAPNAVGVLTTVVFFWAIIAGIGYAWERWRR